MKQNREIVNLILQRRKDRLWQYEPYLNRRDGKPGWQWKFLEAINKYRGRVALGGNRIGKSDQGAYESWLAITDRHPYRKFPAEGKLWLVAENYNKTRDVVLPKFESFMPKEYKAQSTFNKQDKIWWIRGNGREWKAQFKSADGGRRVFEGDAIDAIWFDEEMPEDVFNECMMRLIDRNGIWWMTATPLLGTAWLNNVRHRENIFDVYGASWDNPYLSAEVIEELSRDLSDDEKLVRVEGHYIIFGGKPVFSLKILMKMMEEVEKEVGPESGVLTKVA